MRKPMATAFAAALLLAACKKDRSERLNQPDYVGSWQWIRTDGGIANHIHDTPQSTGKTVLLKLTQDNQFFVYTNDAVASQGTYSVETKTCIHDNTEKPFLNFSPDTGMMVESVNDDTLTLSDEAADGLTSVYGRTGSIK